MSIKRKIWALPAISTVIFGIGIAVSVYFSTSAISSIKTTEEIDYPVVDKSKILTSEIQGVTDALKDAVTEGDKKRVEQIGEQAGKVRESIRKLGEVPGQHAVAERLAKEFDAYYAPALSAARLMLGMDQGDPQAAIGQMQSAQKILETDLVKTSEAAQRQFKKGIENSGNSVRNVLVTSLLVALAVILVLGIVSYFVVRTIWRQLGGEPEYARRIARAVAGGDFSMTIATAPDDTRSLLAALKEMQGRLEGMVSGVKVSAETIKVASAEIASGNADLSARTESQASSLQQTASSMAVLTDTVSRNADNARQANQFVANTSEVAVKGGQVVSEVVATMEEINQSAKKIVDIIGVIDGIAFQTNILALNAAVEAARAGEEGRGFAVVAAEVRSLAQRSAAAAKEIKELISDSVEKVETGYRLVDQAGQRMDEIVASVQKVTGIMSEISAASEEQSSGIQQISSSINHIDDITQQNSALVEEAAAAAEAMKDQANQLIQSLNVFKLSTLAGSTSAPATHNPPTIAAPPRARLGLVSDSA